MKYQNYDRYPTSMITSEKILLSVWKSLKGVETNFTLVGGLVPQYLCGPTQHFAFDAKTIDLDFAISMAADDEIKFELQERFKKCHFEIYGNRLLKKVRGADFYLDLLCDDALHGRDIYTLGGVPANCFSGIARALECFEVKSISGLDYFGHPTTQNIRICGVGPFLCLKLTSLSERREPKDLFDVIKVCRDYSGGFASVVSQFKAESSLNPAYPTAVAAIEQIIAGGTSVGSFANALGEFCFQRSEQESQEHLLKREQTIQMVLAIARQLK